ncbi:hypothetical protein MG296_14245 [Flavobacteriaceae bacterium TK19130]|nr:hypothetical protein [Thermobacterium salinum]
MNLKELSSKELSLYSKVISLKGTIESKINQLDKLGVFDEYQKILHEYAEQSDQLEALKRGLFITWIAASEPHFLTGISNIDKNSIEKLIESLNDKISKKETDYELDWMISYYSKFYFADDIVSKYPYVLKKLQEKIKLPNKIDKHEMTDRGQMGVYWNSLNESD